MRGWTLRKGGPVPPRGLLSRPPRSVQGQREPWLLLHVGRLETELLGSMHPGLQRFPGGAPRSAVI